MPKPCSLELRERVVEGHRVRRIATRGRGMVRSESEFGHQMDAAAAGNRKYSPQAERGQHLAPGGTRGTNRI